MKVIKVYCDGASRGNPGPASSAFVVIDDQDETIVREGKFLGVTTNNVAEYNAILEAHQWLKANEAKIGEAEIKFTLDSELAVKQLNGIYKIKSPHLIPLITQVRKLKSEIKNNITYNHVKRDKNKEADKKANEVLDDAVNS